MSDLIVITMRGCDKQKKLERTISSGQPFVFFDDASSQDDGVTHLYCEPLYTLEARSLGEVGPILEDIRSAINLGRHVAGCITYEAGAALEPKLQILAHKRTNSRPLLWFGVFSCRETLPSSAFMTTLPDSEGSYASAIQPRISSEDYRSLANQVLRYIRAGDIYQLNLSFRADFELLGHPLALYAQIRKAGAGKWSSVAFDGRHWVLSTSPELFFSLQDRIIEARPMKGTIRRDSNPEDDLRLKQTLATDPKQRAENLMIVDLMRNDISRIAKPGSVKVPSLFSVETYPTLHTLTSTIHGELSDGHDAVDVVAALFPCGSITGAPKVRAMELIETLEADARDIYTGSMGWMAPDGSSQFNVAIRTIVAPADKTQATVGLGSGVVLDSVPQEEWDECLLKAAFLTAEKPKFHLQESLRFERGTVQDLDTHMERLAQSARAFEFPFDENRIREIVSIWEKKPLKDGVMKIALDCAGRLDVQVQAEPIISERAIPLQIMELPLPLQDFRLRHNTSLRTALRERYRRGSAQEVVFVSKEGFLLNGTFTNVFVKRNGQFLTPPRDRALYLGVLRMKMINGGDASEADIRWPDIDGDLWVGNSAHGLKRTTVVENCIIGEETP